MPRLNGKSPRKVIRSGATEFHYEREHQPLPKIGPWRERLDAMLLANAAKPAREQLALTRIYEELRGAGYDGSYDAVRRYAKSWREERGAVAFDSDDQPVLEAICKDYEGKNPTPRQTNSHSPDTLAFATWVIARLGGWTGYYGKPGAQTLSRGLQRYFAIQYGSEITRGLV